MVNAKNYAFKVHPQQPNCQASTQAHGAIINCRKPGAKRIARDAKDVLSQQVSFVDVDGVLKRKRAPGDVSEHDASSSRTTPRSDASTSGSSTTVALPERSISHQRPSTIKLHKIKKPKLPSKGVDLDCWFTILSFSDPAQLLEMRRTIPSCYHFLRDNPALWKHSRNYHYGDDLPEPSSELTEFQYADLRHDHGCQSCKTPNTRKTYWAFLRRWCKDCLKKKHCREPEAVAMLRSALNEDLSFLHTCLPAGILDSWGNFVGVGPATTHALKTVYLRSDVNKLVAEYNTLRAQNKDPAAWGAELNAWYEPKVRVVEERRLFAKEMEGWEELMRGARSQDYTLKKAARKAYYLAKASELEPAISARELECCPSYRRAIRIPKDPNSTSWLQLKPKLEKEAAELRAKGRLPEERPAASSASGTSTPISIVSVMEPPQSQPPAQMPQPLPQQHQQQHQHYQQPSLPSISRVTGYQPGQGLPPVPHHALYGSSAPYSLVPPHAQGFTLPHPFHQGPAAFHHQTLAQLHYQTYTQRTSQTLAPIQNQPHGGSHPQSQPPSSTIPPPSSHMF